MIDVEPPDSAPLASSPTNKEPPTKLMHRAPSKENIPKSTPVKNSEMVRRNSRPAPVAPITQTAAAAFTLSRSPPEERKRSASEEVTEERIYGQFFGDEDKYIGAVDSYLLEQQVNQFRNIAKSLLSRVESAPEEYPLLSLLDFTNPLDPLSVLIKSMQKLSFCPENPNKHLQFFVRELYSWRLKQLESQSTNTTTMQKEGSILGKITDTIRKTKKPVHDERTALAIEFLFSKLVLMLLEHSFIATNLDPIYINYLEELAFSHFTKFTKEEKSSGLGEKIFNQPIDTNEEIKKTLIFNYSKILGFLSKVRFSQISNTFKTEIENMTSPKALALLQGLAFVQIEPDRVCADFFNICTKLIFKDKIKHEVVKFALVETILRVVTNSPNVFRDEPEEYWINAMIQNYKDIAEEELGKHRKLKASLLQITYPLMAIFLATSPKHFFLANIWVLFEGLLKHHSKFKSAIFLTIVKMLIFRVMQCLPNNSQDNELLKIVSMLFPPKRLLITDQSEATIALIQMMAGQRIDFTTNYVLLELLRADAISTDRMTLALKVLHAIFTQSKTTYSATHKHVDFSNTDCRKISKKCGLIAFSERLDIAFSNLFHQLDSVCSPLTYLQPPTKIPELMQKLPSIKDSSEILKTALTCVPFLFVDDRKVTQLDFIQNLTRYLVHLDEGLSDSAAQTLSRLMQYSPVTRFQIVHVLIKFIFGLPHPQHEKKNITQRTLQFLANLTQEHSKWYSGVKKQKLPAFCQSTKDMKSHAGIDSVVNFLEGIALVFLCYPSLKIRTAAMELIRAARDIHRASERTEYEIRVADVFDQSGDDILDRVNREMHLVQSGPFSELCALGNSQSDQTRWTLCLGELINFVKELCPAPAQVALEQIVLRIPSVQPEEIKGFATEEFSVIWRNYVIVLCSTIDPTFPTLKKGSLETVLTNMILPYLKTDFQEIISVGLERISYSAYLTMFEALKPYEVFSKKDSAKKDKIRLRNSIGLIYSSSAKRIYNPKKFLKNTKLKQVFLNYIQEHCRVHAGSPTDYLWDHNQLDRLHFCHTTKFVVQHFHACDHQFDSTLKKDLFQLFKIWSEGQESSDEQSKRKMQSALSKMKEPQKTNYSLALQGSISGLQMASIEAIGSLFLGPNCEIVPQDAFKWMDTILTHSSLTSVSQHTLCKYLQEKLHKPEVLQYALNQCYSETPEIAKSYFSALLEAIKHDSFEETLSIPLIYLFVLKIGNPKRSMRNSALEGLRILYTHPEFLQVLLNTVQNPLNSSLSQVNQNAQLQISAVIAETVNDQPRHIIYDFFNEMVLRIDLVDSYTHTKMLKFILPWIMKMNLEELALPTRHFILENLLIVTHHYSHTQFSEINELWATLAGNYRNVTPVIEFLLEVGVKLQNQNLIPLAKKVAIYLARSKPQMVIDILANELSCSAAVLNEERPARFAAAQSVSIANTEPSAFSRVFSQGKSRIGRADLALFLLADLSYESAEWFYPNLPVVLQLLFLKFDAPDVRVHDHCRVLMTNLIAGWLQKTKGTNSRSGSSASSLSNNNILSKSSSNGSVSTTDNGVSEAAWQLQDLLQSRVHQQLWEHEDPSLSNPQIKSARQLAAVGAQVCTVFSLDKKTKETWAIEAISWAVHCPSAHLIARSLQILRVLRHPLSRETLFDLLRTFAHFWALSVADPAHFGLVLEVAFTLQAVVEHMDSGKLIMYPPIFWTAVAVLYSDYDVLHAQALKLVTMVVERLDFADNTTQTIFSTSIPSWHPPFRGVQPLVIRGLFSPLTEDHAAHLLALLAGLVCCDDVIDPRPGRFVIAVAGLLHVLAWGLDHKLPPLHIGIAQALARASAARELHALQKLFVSYAEMQVGSSTEFLEHVCELVAVLIPPSEVVAVFGLLFNLLEVGPSRYQQYLLQELMHFVRFKRAQYAALASFSRKAPSWIRYMYGLVEQTGNLMAQDVLFWMVQKPDPKDLPLHIEDPHANSLREVNVKDNFSTPSGPVRKNSAQTVSNNNSSSFLSNPKDEAGVFFDYKPFANTARAGTYHTIKCLEAIYDVFTQNEDRAVEKEKRVISPQFWDNFFSETNTKGAKGTLHDKDHNKNTLESQSTEPDTYPSSDSDSEQQPEEPSLIRAPIGQKDTSHPLLQMNQFPSMHGFEDLLNFDDD